MGLRDRLERLEDLAGPGLGMWGPWPAGDQLEDVLDALWLHRCGGSVYPATDRELRLIAAACAGEEITGDVRPEDLPEGVREYFERMDPAKQPARERYLYENRRMAGEPTGREKVRLHEEKVQAYAEESRQRDRELLERNRASVGLAPLTPEEIEKWKLECTAWGGS